jgi:hypothetical protein
MTPEVAMNRIGRVFVSLCTTGLIAATGWAANGHKKSVSISESRNGKGVVIAVSEALAREVLEGALGTELDCRAEIDPDFEVLLRMLDERGRGSRATLRDGDTVVRARRRGKSIRFDISGSDHEGKIEAIVPWALAECLLGRATKVHDTAGPIKVKITGEGGGTFKFEVD